MRCHVNQSQNNKPPASPSPSWMNVTPRWRHCAATLHSQSKHLHSGTSLHTELGSCSRRIWDLSKLFTFPASNRHGNFEQFCFLISYLNYLYFSRFVVLIVKVFFPCTFFFFFPFGRQDEESVAFLPRRAVDWVYQRQGKRAFILGSAFTVGSLT